MNAFIIEVAGERKEEFAYEQPLNEEAERAFWNTRAQTTAPVQNCVA
jgi:hypothetical protein